LFPSERGACLEVTSPSDSNLAHSRQSRLNSSLGFQTKVLNTELLPLRAKSEARGALACQMVAIFLAYTSILVDICLWDTYLESYNTKYTSVDI